MTSHTTTSTPIDTVLVANRGEIACRVMRTLKDQGVRSVAVYSDADADALHTRTADVAVHIGPSAARESYLVIDKIIAAAKETGAQAIHPGYGFLSENAAFARACEDNGIIFMGPSAQAIETMGDKISARAAVEARDVPTVPGISRPGLTDADIIAAAPAIGFPVLIKPSAGGGGKGMHVVTEPDKLADALVTARREAASAFGDDALFLEHFVDTPRHIEVQIVADSHGNVVHLGERECSLQRRHQKVIEEAPSPLLDEQTRARIGQAACDAARSVGYVGAGTVEFIVPAKNPDQFFFMEMNTRLQVEHPVTEEVTGIDLVATQLAIARGKQLPFTQDDITLIGHSIEARIYAEDPAGGFLPTGGTVTALHLPSGEGVRVDTGIVAGSEVTSLYDPMLMKVIVHGADREQALDRLDHALASTVVGGLGVNTDFCRFLTQVQQVRSGDMDTGLLERVAGDYKPTAVPADALAVAAVLKGSASSASNAAARTTGAWAADGFSLQGAAPTYTLVSWDDGHTIVAVRPVGPRWEVTVNAVPDFVRALAHKAGEDAVAALNDLPEPQDFSLGREVENWTLEPAGEQYLLRSADAAWLLDLGPAAVPTFQAGTEEKGSLSSPMPGTVVALSVEEGAHVSAGDPVLVVEAMKMEHVLTATEDGTVTFHCAPGDSVPAGEALATIVPREPAV